jgi:hypothetical protein
MQGDLHHDFARSRRTRMRPVGALGAQDLDVRVAKLGEARAFEQARRAQNEVPAEALCFSGSISPSNENQPGDFVAQNLAQALSVAGGGRP